MICMRNREKMGEQSQILNLKGFLKNADSSWVYLLGMSHLGTIFVYEIKTIATNFFAKYFYPSSIFSPFLLRRFE